MKLNYILSVVLLILNYSCGFSQTVTNSLGQTNGFIPTAVPFLLIAPDARSNGMGDVGAATSPDASSLHWNPAKIAFINPDFGISVSYLPWLRQLVNDINYSNISAYAKIDSNRKIGCSFKYFSLGGISMVGPKGLLIKGDNPVEYSIDIAYSGKFSKKTSGAISIRYIYSEVLNTNVFYYPSRETHKTFAFDLSLFHFNPINLFETPSRISYGIALTNIGPLIKNDNDSLRFLPANLRIGTSLRIPVSENHSVEISFDANKLLAPDNPGNYCDPKNGFCLFGPSQPKSWSEGFFGSFTDAPGGTKEELKEINFSTGIEYWFRRLIAFRTGYFYESSLKGNRKFLTLGSGIKYKSFCFDLAYLIPSEQRNPLENTMTFSLSYYFSKTNQTQIKKFSS